MTILNPPSQPKQYECVHFHELLTLAIDEKTRVFELAWINIVSEMEGQGTSLHIWEIEKICPLNSCNKNYCYYLFSVRFISFSKIIINVCLQVHCIMFSLWWHFICISEHVWCRLILFKHCRILLLLIRFYAESLTEGN